MASIWVAHILFLGSFILGEVNHHVMSSLVDRLVWKGTETFDHGFRISLEKDPPAPIEPSDDYSPG